MVHGDGKTDHLDRWLNPEEKKRARVIWLRFETDDKTETITAKAANY